MKIFFGEMWKRLRRRYSEALRGERDLSLLNPKAHWRQWKNSMLLVWTMATILIIVGYIYIDLTSFHFGPADFVFYFGFILLYSAVTYVMVYIAGFILFLLLSAIRNGIKKLLR